jgi:hypothetical protein
MPRASFPAAAPAEFKKQQGFLPIVLVDILLRDGTTYYFSDVGGTYTVKLGAGPHGRLFAVDRLRRSLHLHEGQQTDAGDLVLQNISGNSIERDMAKAMKAHEFEGALCVIRYWHALLALSVLEFHGTLGNQRDLGDTCDFRFKQLMDANRSTRWWIRSASPARGPLRRTRAAAPLASLPPAIRPTRNARTRTISQSSITAGSRSCRRSLNPSKRS